MLIIILGGVIGVLLIAVAVLWCRRGKNIYPQKGDTLEDDLELAAISHAKSYQDETNTLAGEMLKRTSNKRGPETPRDTPGLTLGGKRSLNKDATVMNVPDTVEFEAFGAPPEANMYQANDRGSIVFTPGLSHVGPASQEAEGGETIQEEESESAVEFVTLDGKPNLNLQRSAMEIEEGTLPDSFYGSTNASSEGMTTPTGDRGRGESDKV
jgi:hypothetical protein